LLAVVGVLHAVVLLALSLGGAPTLALALLAAAYAATAGRSAWLLRRGALDRLPGWLALWAGSVMAVIGVTGTTFGPGAMFWWNAAAASVAWLLGGAWLARRVVAEAGGGPAAAGARRPEVWLYRGAWQEWPVTEATWLVPMSQEELRVKIQAIFKHQSQKDSAPFPGQDEREFWQRVEQRNKETARTLDRLGLAEYFAMEAYVVDAPAGDAAHTGAA